MKAQLAIVLSFWLILICAGAMPIDGSDSPKSQVQNVSQTMVIIQL